MQSDKKDLASHPFPQKVMDNLRPQLEASSRKLKALAKKGKVRSKEKYELWEHQWYDYDVFTHLSAIISGADRLEQIQNFISTFPRPRSYEKEGINQHTWIEYHYSYYVITLVSLFDIALVLTNSVFRLGNREQDCKRDLIMMNSWVRKTPATQALADLNQLIESYREGRNRHVHRGKVHNIASVMRSDELDLLHLVSTVHMFTEPLIDQKMIDLAYKPSVQEIREMLQKERGRIHDGIWRLFDGVSPTYNDTSNALHKKWSGIFEKELERRRTRKKKPA